MILARLGAYVVGVGFRATQPPPDTDAALQRIFYHYVDTSPGTLALARAAVALALEEEAGPPSSL